MYIFHVAIAFDPKFERLKKTTTTSGELGTNEQLQLRNQRKFL